MAKKEYIKSEVTRAARPRSERLRSLGLQTSGGGGTTSAGGLASMYLETLRSRIDTHAKDTTVHVTADEKSLWNSLASLFELVDIGTEESPLKAIRAKYGLFSDSFLSAHGSDPEAGQGGVGGLDIDAMWDALAESGTQKINASHIPLLQQLSGTLTNAQLANSSLSIAGVEVPLGGSVSAEQIASALGLGSNAYTSTAYLPLAGGTMSGTLTFPTATEAYNSLGVRFSGVSSRIGVDAAGGLGLYAQDAIYLRPSWTSGGTLYGLIIRASDLTYNGNPLLHAGNYKNYTVTKTGVGASGTWPISVSGSSNTLISTTVTAISNYVRYHQVSGSPSLVGSTAGGGAWGLPSTGPDAEYGNGQILRLGWSPEYYTDIFTGPNDFGSAAGLQFRQIVNGKMSSRGWRTLLDSANYTSYAVSLTGAQTISGAKTFTSLVTATGGVYSPKGLFGLTEAQANSYAGSGYYYKLAVGQQSPSMGASLLLYRDSTSYQSYIVWSTGSADHVGVGLKNGTNDFDITNHKGAIKLIGQGILTYNNYTLWHAGNDGSGSGLNADLLDGYHSTSFDLATNLGACQDYGCYVIGLMQITDYTTAGNHANGELIFMRQNGNNPAQKIIYSLSTRYGSTNVRFGYLLFSTISYVMPCTFTYNGKKWAGFCVDAASSYSSGITCIRDGARFGERSTPFLLKFKVSNTGQILNSEVNDSLVVNGSDIIECGVSARSFIGALSGNASSATKLATARLLWGRSFDGSGDIRGNIIVGDAIIHGSVTSNNTRFISSDNASNIYFSVGGLVDLVAEPSCLRRGASNTSETLGTSTYRWANVYAVNGDFSGNLTVSGWLNGGLNISIFGSNSDNSDTTRFSTYGHRVEFGGPGYAHKAYYFRPMYSANGVTYASVYIQNASAAASPVFTTTHAFDHNGNAYHIGNLGLGTSAPAAKLHVVGGGLFTDLVQAQKGVQIGSTSDFGWYYSGHRIAAGLSNARGVNVGSLLVSGLWSDAGKVPTNGIYSKGDIYSMGAISCRGADSQAADASSGIDSNALWNVLGAVGAEKINASHLPDSSKTLTCSTAAGTAAKVVTCTGFQLTTGAAVTVRFTSGNSAASPTLNVNGTGAKGIRVYRGTSLVTPFANWNANVTVELTYNGTYWVITGNPVVYSLNAASASDSSGTYYRTARIFADGWKEYAFVTNASGNDRTLTMPYAFSSVNSMGVVVTLFGTAPGAGNVKSKSTSSVTVDFSTSTASTSKRGTVLCFGY